MNEREARAKIAEHVKVLESAESTTTQREEALMAAQDLAQDFEIDFTWTDQFGRLQEFQGYQTSEYEGSSC